MEIKGTKIEGKEQSFFTIMFAQYERVVIESIAQSFCLDFLVQDQHGGAVDTIHNVREIGRDPEMGYKQTSNKADYDSRGAYDAHAYHAGGTFQKLKHDARKKWHETGIDIQDEYTGGNIGFHGHTKVVDPKMKAELDHVVECKGVFDDRGRVLSGLRGEDLVDCAENLAWTNKSLNASMGSWARQKNERWKKEHDGKEAPLDEVGIEAYLRENPDAVDSATKERMLKQAEKSRKAYDAKIERSYYTSKKFMKATAAVAAKTGFKMGLRQALGVVFAEIWFAVRDEVADWKAEASALMRQIGNGIMKGLNNAKQRWKDLWNRFLDGAVAGILSSLTTTLCNIFFSTAKMFVRIIRQTWASLVDAVKILIFNPDELSMGERIRAASKIIATAASVVAGILVSEGLNKVTAGLPFADIVNGFCGTLLSGILSCTLLYFIDNDPRINRLVAYLNSLPSESNERARRKRQCQLLEQYSAALMNLDLDSLRQEMSLYRDVAVSLSVADCFELNSQLRFISDSMGIDAHTSGYSDFRSALADPNFQPSFE